MKTRAKATAIAASLFAIALVAAWYFLVFKAPTPLSDEISEFLDGETIWVIDSIESMEEDESPTFSQTTDNESSIHGKIKAAIDEARITYERDEIGAVLDGKLYTITVSSPSGKTKMSFTLNNKNELHINDNEKTYLLQDDELYKLCESLSYC